ncbi:hypothetical protein PFB07_20885, partial [Paracoccus sp. AS002]|nr:hypothetical protein [Paracoccus sp. AS002]
MENPAPPETGRREAAGRALVDGGIGAVTIPPLARLRRLPRAGFRRFFGDGGAAPDVRARFPRAFEARPECAPRCRAVQGRQVDALTVCFASRCPECRRTTAISEHPDPFPSAARPRLDAQGAASRLAPIPATARIRPGRRQTARFSLCLRHEADARMSRLGRPARPRMPGPADDIVARHAAIVASGMRRAGDDAPWAARGPPVVALPGSEPAPLSAPSGSCMPGPPVGFAPAARTGTTGRDDNRQEPAPAQEASPVCATAGVWGPCSRQGEREWEDGLF